MIVGLVRVENTAGAASKGAPHSLARPSRDAKSDNFLVLTFGSCRHAGTFRGMGSENNFHQSEIRC